jgi:hypothetical protein
MFSVVATKAPEERRNIRVRGVAPVTALVLAAAIAVSPLADHEARVVRQCIWNFHVFLCRWRTVDTPPGRQPTAPTTTDSVAAYSYFHLGDLHGRSGELGPAT